MGGIFVKTTGVAEQDDANGDLDNDETTDMEKEEDYETASSSSTTPLVVAASAPAEVAFAYVVA